MDKEKVIKYVHELSWECPKEKQIRAMEFLSHLDEDYRKFIFNKELKSTWENAVKVIKKIGFPNNKMLLSDMVWLLQDINWPGSREALKVLLLAEKKTVIPLIKEALLLAESNDDAMWIAGIKIFITEAGLSEEDFEKEKIYQILKKADF